MSASQPARKRLPVKPSAEHLRKQAKRLARDHQLPLADAQHRLAGEYGARSWADLMHIVETMLRGADQLVGVKYEMEALPKAANANDLERVRAILASGAFTQHDLDLALARSVLRFDHRGEIARLLLEHGADPDGQYGSNYGPIIFVTGECLDVEGLKFLIAAGADVTFEPIDTKYGRVCPLSSWLSTYVRGRNQAKHEGIALLLQHGAIIPPEVTPEVLAIHRGDANALAALLDADPSMLDRRFETMPYGNLSLTGARLIHYAAEFGEIECAALLLERGANPRLESADKRVPLHHAAHNGPRAMVELLIRYNAKTWQADQEGRLPIDYARTGVAADKDAIVHLLDRPVLDDPHFRAAVNAIHAGDLATLRQLLKDHPNLSRDRAVEPDCYPESDYFGSPKLLWFVANNPTLIKTMPDNMTEIASAIIDTGVAREDLNYTLELVMTSEPARAQGLQLQLMRLLLARGAAVQPRAIQMTLGHAIHEPVVMLIDEGHLPLTASSAAGLGRLDDLVRLLPDVDPAELHAALSLAVINRQVECAARCLDAGADANAFLIVHAHSTPLHQAAINADVPMLQLLLARGARLDIRDTLWHGTPLDWARHGGHSQIAEMLTA